MLTAHMYRCVAGCYYCEGCSELKTACSEWLCQCLPGRCSAKLRPGGGGRHPAHGITLRHVASHCKWAFTRPRFRAAEPGASRWRRACIARPPKCCPSARRGQVRTGRAYCCAGTLTCPLVLTNAVHKSCVHSHQQPSLLRISSLVHSFPFCQRAKAAVCRWCTARCMRCRLISNQCLVPTSICAPLFACRGCRLEAGAPLAGRAAGLAVCAAADRAAATRHRCAWCVLLLGMLWCCCACAGHAPVAQAGSRRTLRWAVDVQRKMPPDLPSVCLLFQTRGVAAAGACGA